MASEVLPGSVVMTLSEGLAVTARFSVVKKDGSQVTAHHAGVVVAVEPGGVTARVRFAAASSEETIPRSSLRHRRSGSDEQERDSAAPSADGERRPKRARFAPEITYDVTRRAIIPHCLGARVEVCELNSATRPPLPPPARDA